MTPEEIIALLDAQNREILKSMGLSTSSAALDLMNRAGANGFALGSRAALSGIEGALAVFSAKGSKQ